MKEHTFKDFIKSHKRELAIAALTSVAGVAGGILLHQGYVSTKYGELIESIKPFGVDAFGRTMIDDTVRFFNEATYSVEAMQPNCTQTIQQVFGDGAGCKFLADHNFSPNTVVSGILVGIKASES